MSAWKTKELEETDKCEIIMLRNIEHMVPSTRNPIARRTNNSNLNAIKTTIGRNNEIPKTAYMLIMFVSIEHI